MTSECQTLIATLSRLHAALRTALASDQPDRSAHLIAEREVLLRRLATALARLDPRTRAALGTALEQLAAEDAALLALARATLEAIGAQLARGRPTPSPAVPETPGQVSLDRRA